MFALGTKNKKSYSKSILLTAIYAIHLLCFQVLMAAPGNSNVEGSTFKPLFTVTHAHSQQTPISHKPKHPAVTYYAMLIKQGNSAMHSQTESPVVFLHTIKIATLQIIGTQRFVHLPQIAYHPSDVHYELYRLAGAFII